MTTWILLVFAVLVFIGGILRRARMREARRRELSQEMVRQIEQEGSIRWERDDLDLDAIREEEDRFWEQSWDEPEPL